MPQTTVVRLRLMHLRPWFLVRTTRFAVEVELPELLDSPRFLVALAVASPSLHVHLANGTLAEKQRAALGRYADRARNRPTPFGLFAGTCPGEFGGATALKVPERNAWKVSAETAIAARLADAFAQDDEVASDVRVRLNPLAFRLHDTWMVSQRRNGAWADNAIEHSDAIDAISDATRTHDVSLKALEELLVSRLDATPSESSAFLRHLIRSEFLIRQNFPPIIGTRAEREHSFDGVSEHELDRGNFGRITASELSNVRLATSSTERTLILPDAVRDEVQRFVGIVGTLPSSRSKRLAEFRERFAHRYEQRWVSLLECTHDKLGVGFREPGVGDWNTAPGHIADALASAVDDAETEGRSTVDVTSILNALRREAAGNAKPRSVAVLSRIATSSALALESGDFALTEPTAYGLSASFLLARFARRDELLLDRLRTLADEEQRLRPDVQLVDVASFATGRSSNSHVHPRIRPVTLEATGTSADGRKLSLYDVEVTVRDTKVLLRNRRDGSLIEPRFSSPIAATNPAWHRAVDFLYDVAHDNYPIGRLVVPAESERLHVPRIVSGRCVFSAEQWRIRPSISQKKGGERGFENDLRRTLDARGVPEQVEWWLNDERLLLDWKRDHDAFDELVRAARSGKPIVLKEHIPTNILHSEDGTHAAEFMFVAGPDPRVLPKEPPLEVRTTQELEPPAPMSERVLSLGGFCTYLKIYADDRACDRIVHAIVDEIAKHAKKLGIVRWHFLHFADPEPHLRVRFFRDRRGSDAIIRRIDNVLRPYLESGRVWKVQQDTYQRELERYGGTFGIELAERIFDADSDFAIAALDGVTLTDDWRIGVAAVSIARTLDDFGLSLGEQIAWIKDRCDGYTKELGLAESFRKVVCNWRTAYGATLRSVLDGTHDERQLLDALDMRSSLFARVATKLSTSTLASRRNELLASYTHLGCARIFTEDLRIREAQALEVLRREFETRMHRNVTR